MFTIENNQLLVTIQSKGAELQSIIHKEHELEYLWSADPAFWPKKSPVLFPIVGALKENTFYYNGQAYQLSRHGFAREKDFTVTTQKTDAISFSISSNKDTLQQYPFPFRLTITYTLVADTLEVTYAVENTGASTMYFSIGGHPAFKVPLVEGTIYDDYELQFNKTENAGRWPIAAEGLLESQPLPLLNHTQVLPLSKALFMQDALVLKNLQSHAVTLASHKTPHGLQFDFSGFPYLGLWAAPGADFLCIEPWCGIADSVNSNQQLPEKEGIQTLAADGAFERAWRARFY
jgi:galactose mutarotase-like enzyme